MKQMLDLGAEVDRMLERVVRRAAQSKSAPTQPSHKQAGTETSDRNPREGRHTPPWRTPLPQVQQASSSKRSGIQRRAARAAIQGWSERRNRDTDQETHNKQHSSWYYQ